MEHRFLHQQRKPLPPLPLPLRLSLSPNPSPLPGSWPPPFDDWLFQHPHQQQQQQRHNPQHHAPLLSPSGPSGDSSHLDEAIWQMMLQSSEEIDFATGPFPERRGEPDCAYYMRTGLCSYGMNCRFNHPSNRKLALALSRDKGEYPERIGQPECQYYLKTGTCKFGSTCKYHHPKERAGSWGRVTTNVMGLPLRPGERDCAYYMRNGLCKFGITCKFNHPQPATFGGLVAMSGSSAYVPADSSSTPSQQPFRTGLPSWQVARTPYITSSRFQGPSSFGPLIVQPQNLVSLPGWSTYQAQMGSMTSLETQQQALGSSFLYGAAPTDAASGGMHPSYNPYLPGSAATGFPSMQMQSTSVSGDLVFPERPGIAECQYYMRTGDCKFGMSCRFHHPRERISSLPTSILSPIGLPLRPGVPQCRFYSRHGACKFGATCKFDHPMSNLRYSPSASSLLDMPIAPYPVGSSGLVASSSETSIQGPKNPLREAGSPSGEKESYKSSYMDGSTDEIASNSVQSGTSIKNRPSSSDSAESRGN